MTLDPTLSLGLTAREPRVAATAVSEADYMRDHAESFHEWVDGAVIRKSPVTAEHDNLAYFLRGLLETYFVFQPIGQVKSAPFVMKPGADARRREPDLQIIRHDNPGSLTDTAMLGPADICIEIVSEGSEEIDFGSKFVEYQRGGVREYWLIDPLRHEARFYRLNAEGIYLSQPVDAQGRYTTPLLPAFKLDTALLWSAPLPNPVQILALVQTMFPSG
ncbi:MAG: Uma2 family endonuclease [Anaerolineae bacterium]|nr:Uma2 family endonuclease [Anaerolineae bacterium]